MENANISSTVTSTTSREEERQVEEETTRERPDWTLLPPDLIIKIGEELSIPNRVCFRATCKTWYNAVLPIAVPSPWLLIPDDESEQSHSCTFLSLPAAHFFTYSPIPELRGTRCIGSHAGWLAISNTQLDVSLLNPLTMSRIHLPSFITLPTDDLILEIDVFWMDDALIDVSAYNPPKVFRDCFIDKLVFSSKPTIHNHIAVTLYGTYGDLAYTKAGKDEWLLLGAASTKDHYYEDVMFHDDKFYCLTNESQVQAFDLSADCPTVAIVVQSLKHNIRASIINLTYKKCLACSRTGELFMFLRRINQPVLPLIIELRDPKDFMVLRANPETNLCWAATNDLGSMSLFVGANNSILISNEDLPILQGDCIFFIDTYTAVSSNDIEQLTCKVRWFDLKEERRDTYYASSSSQLDLASVIWFTPSLQ
ncbi:hypothetical protein BHM03_00046742 [Ensete ventricosum]|nr:hypothetical protein BHM03_00046742 [Ensete ventricosum]